MSRFALYNSWGHRWWPWTERHTRTWFTSLASTPIFPLCIRLPSSAFWNIRTGVFPRKQPKDPIWPPVSQHQSTVFVITIFSFTFWKGRKTLTSSWQVGQKKALCQRSRMSSGPCAGLFKGPWFQCTASCHSWGSFAWHPLTKDPTHVGWWTLPTLPTFLHSGRRHRLIDWLCPLSITWPNHFR